MHSSQYRSRSRSPRPGESTIAPNDNGGYGFCHRCNAPHDWAKNEYMNCRPPLDVVQFGEHRMSLAYREALYQLCSDYTTEEIVGSFLGHNPNFPTEEQWLRGVRPNHSSLLGF
mmetsp:Transcript_62246/g.143322  ORF Transcript_62246/g.143322 Transcript_62246/m.143322 type:complete len:114 (-) Transcript_62246:146-487(-)